MTTLQADPGRPHCIACHKQLEDEHLKIALHEQPPGDDLAIRNPVETECFYACHRCHYEATKRMIEVFGAQASELHQLRQERRAMREMEKPESGKE